MRWIITGGTGFIGHALVKSLAQDGHEVIILTRAPGHAGAGKVRYEHWDGTSAQGWGRLADGADAIVNLAGENIGQRWSDDIKRRIIESRKNAGKAIVEAVTAAGKKPAFLFQASAVGYYGPHGAEPLAETSPAGSDFLAQVCQAWEASTADVEAQGVRRVVGRIGIVLEKEGGALQRLLLPFRLFVGGPLGNGQQMYSWVHRDDVVGTIRFLMNRAGAHGVYNITAPQPISNKAFSRALGEVMGRPSWMPVPGFAMRLILADGADFILSGQHVLPEHLLADRYTFKFPEIHAAFRDILQKAA